MQPPLTTDIQKTIGDQSEAAPLAVEDVTEASIDLGLVGVHPAVQDHLGPAQDMELISQDWRLPAGVVLSYSSLVTSEVGGTEGQPLSAAQSGRS